MMRPTSILLLVAAVASAIPSVSAGIFLPGGGSARSLADMGRSSGSSDADAAFHGRRNLDRALTKQSAFFSKGSVGRPLALAIPGNGIAEQVVVGGFGNFIAIYNTVITGRILLSWFPQAQGIAVLQPVFAITDPYLNLFRGIIPPIFGLDLSPILAFVTLDLLGKSAVSLAAEVPEEMKKKLQGSKFGRAMQQGRANIAM